MEGDDLVSTGVSLTPNIVVNSVDARTIELRMRKSKGLDGTAAISTSTGSIMSIARRRKNGRRQDAELALSQRLSSLGLIFRSSAQTSGKMLLINFRIS